jgi:hypothetical protein
MPFSLSATPHAQAETPLPMMATRFTTGPLDSAMK